MNNILRKLADSLEQLQQLQASRRQPHYHDNTVAEFFATIKKRIIKCKKYPHDKMRKLGSPSQPQKLNILSTLAVKSILIYPNQAPRCQIKVNCMFLFRGCFIIDKREYLWNVLKLLSCQLA